MEQLNIPVTYLLVLHLARPARIGIGSLGEFDFAEGYYLYVGSARKNARSRLERHMRGSAVKKRWHIDYLRPHCTMVRVIAGHADSMAECQLAEQVRQVPGAVNPVKRFGSSDCRCPAHLFYLGQEAPDLAVIAGLMPQAMEVAIS